MSEQAESMHDALSEAFDTTDTDAPPSTEPDAPALELATETGEVQAAVPADEKSTGTLQLNDAPNKGGDAPSEVAAKAPQSWGVTEREGWNALSPEIQTQISKRESEIQQALTHSGEARKFHEEFNQAVSPYLGFINAEGGTPMSAFQTLMQTGATLQAGSPGQKAERIAELIGHYGVDIRQLDSILAGNMPQENDDSRFSAMLDEKMAPMQQFMNQQAQQTHYQQTQLQAQSQNEVGEFIAQHEFAEDVKFQMADLMEMAGRRNESLTIDKAYEQALLLRPDVQQVIEQRKAAANAQQGNANIAQKRQAAVSIPGGDAIATGEAPPNSMRDAIEHAMGDR